MTNGTQTPVSRKEKNQGMNWITPHKRLAIYLRDGLACAYCQRGLEHGVKLTLDHLRPYSKGGSNAEANLVTCCHTCNSSRGNRGWRAFAAAVAGYVDRGVTGAQIVAFVTKTTRRQLDVAAAKALIAQRGGFTSALYNQQEA